MIAIENFPAGSAKKIQKKENFAKKLCTKNAQKSDTGSCSGTLQHVPDPRAGGRIGKKPEYRLNDFVFFVWQRAPQAD